MKQRPGFVKALVTCATIGIAAIGIGSSVAEAQSRGMLQVSANVVSTDNAFRALDAARAAVRTASGLTSSRSAQAAPTVARVAMVQERRAVIVTIDYSRN